MSSSQVRRVLLVIEAPDEGVTCFHHLVPVGPLGIVSFLESKGISTELVDLNVGDTFPDPSNYDAIGFSVTNVNLKNTLKRTLWLRKEFPEMRIFCGGPETVAHPETLCERLQLDAVIIGEAESTIYKYLRASNPGRVPGLVVRGADGRCHPTGKAQDVKSLDSLPFPALNRMDLSRYNSPIQKKGPSSIIITSRGCPYGCTFCYHSHGSRWRARSARNVVDEISWQVNKLGVREIMVYDDTFTLDRARVSKICAEIRKQDIDVLLQIRTRPDLVSRGLLEEMKAAGVWLVGFGFESGNPATLRRIRKDFSLAKAAEVIKWCRELGLTTRTFFILGFPWEGKEEVNNTLRFAQELDADITQFTRLIYFPGTPLYDEFASGSSEYESQGFFEGERARRGALSSLDEEFLQRAIRRAYRSTTMRPRNIFRLMRTLPLASFVHTTRFALATKNL